MKKKTLEKIRIVKSPIRRTNNPQFQEQIEEPETVKI